MHQVLETHAPEVDAGVDESEDRQHAERNDGMQVMFQLAQR